MNKNDINTKAIKISSYNRIQNVLNSMVKYNREKKTICLSGLFYFLIKLGCFI